MPCTESASLSFMITREVSRTWSLNQFCDEIQLYFSLTVILDSLPHSLFSYLLLYKTNPHASEGLKVCLVVSNSLRKTHGLAFHGLPCPGIFKSKNTGVAGHFPTPETFQPRDRSRIFTVSALACGFFTTVLSGTLGEVNAFKAQSGQSNI